MSTSTFIGWLIAAPIIAIVLYIGTLKLIKYILVKWFLIRLKFMMRKFMKKVNKTLEDLQSSLESWSEEIVKMVDDAERQASLELLEKCSNNFNLIGQEITNCESEGK